MLQKATVVSLMKNYLRLLVIWKSGNFVFGIALCLLRAELSQTPQK